MRALMTLVIALAGLYAGYWAIGAEALRSKITAALQEARASGQAEFGELTLMGFPSRFDLTLDAPALTSADGRAEWRAPFLQVFALSYRPNHVIVVWPARQELRLGEARIAIESRDMRASIVFGAATSLPLDRSSLVAEGLTIGGAEGTEIGEARMATRQVGANAASHELGVSLTAIRFPQAVRRRASGATALPEVADWLQLRLRADLDRPLDRHAMTEGKVRPRELIIEEVSFAWGPVRLDGAGRLEIGADGLAEGRIDLTAQNWRPILALLVAGGAVKPEIAPTIEDALSRLALAGGNAERLEIPLIFSAGRMRLGPLPLGPAPRF